MPTVESDVISRRLRNLSKLLSMIEPIPDEWKVERADLADSSAPKMRLGDCRDYRQLIGVWRKALRWTDGLDCALSVMLASITSLKSVGDALWCKVISPPSSGKSVLCEAISTCHEYVVAKSTNRGFHSGYKGAGDAEEDHSLVAELNGKTLVTKDGDTLLQAPNLGQILAEARDIYDGTSRTHYRNGKGKDYNNIRMTWILCGTSSLRQIDSSELGERFLDCVIMEGIPDELEDEILWRVANRVDRHMAVESNGHPETQYEPDMAAAMSLTGGYVKYLRENATELLSQTSIEEVDLRRITRLGKFVAFMRARPSKKQDETSEREFAARLVSQLVRLAKCLAVVLNRTTADVEVMRRVEKVAMDTSRGPTLEIVKRLVNNNDGLDMRAISLYVNTPDAKTRELVRFLGKIGAVERNLDPLPTGAKTKQQHYRLTERMRKLAAEVGFS